MFRFVAVFCFLLLFTIEIEGFDINLKYCRFKCADRCKEQKEQAKEKSKTVIEGYYWRDFYGKIPDDAYPLGDFDQYPQTYIGSVFDPSKNGTFTTTIIEGLDYVYSTLNGTVTKLNENIQILCTLKPETLEWKNLTTTNVENYSQNYIFVQSPGRYAKVGKYPLYTPHYIVKHTECKVAYASYQSKLEVETDFVFMDGTLGKTKDTKFLLYKKGADKATGKAKTLPYVRHIYSYAFKPDSIIPRFYKQLVIGSCSITCTNQGKGGKDATENSEQKKKSSTAMDYYWKYSTIWDEKEGILGGTDYNNKNLYVGQTITSYNWFDIGKSTGSSVSIKNGNIAYVESSYVQILSTNKMDKFEWVPTSSDTFGELDKSKIVPGGSMDNGTLIYVGRHKSGDRYFPGSIREFLTQTVIYTYATDSTEFEVLMLKE